MRADLVHCVSKESARQLLTLFPTISESRIRIVYHGVKPCAPVAVDSLKLRTGGFVLWVGKRWGYKNGSIAYSALRLLPDVDLVFVGGEAPSDFERTLAVRLGIADRVHYVGFVSTSELAWAYTHSIALWYMSVVEGFGLPVVEAAAYGCPAITASNDAVREVAGGWALMTDRPNPEWLAATTMRVAGRGARQEIGQRGRALASKFSWEANSQQMLQIYSELGLPYVVTKSGRFTAG
jgi:mannosyltransferase